MARPALIFTVCFGLGFGLAACAFGDQGTPDLGPGFREVRPAPRAQQQLSLQLSGELDLPRWAQVAVIGYVGGTEDSWVPGIEDRIAELWWSDPLRMSFPLAVSTEMRGSNRLLVLLDRDGDSQPSRGDLWSPLLRRELVGGPPVPIEVPLRPIQEQELWLREAIARMDSPSDDEDAVIGPRPGEQVVLQDLELGRSLGVPRDLRGWVYIWGYEPGLLEGGLPALSDLPLSSWSGGERPAIWPSPIKAKLPVGLDLLVFVDSDSSFGLSPGDWIANPVVRFRPSVDETLQLTLSDRFVGEDESESDASEMEGDALPSRTLSGPVVLDIESKASLSLLQQTRVLFVGFEGPLKDHARDIFSTKPDFLWTSPKVHMSSKLQQELSIPAGITLYVVLDINNDGYPSPEEPMSGPVRGSRALIDRVVLAD